MTVALYANIILLLCVGVATECDTWNSDVENEQPGYLSIEYRVILDTYKGIFQNCLTKGR